MDHRLTFRKYRESDLAFLVWLRSVTMRSHLVNSGVAIDETGELERVKYRLDCAQIITRKGYDIGLLKVCRDGNPWELSQIQIAPEHQGHGIGGALIETVLTDARKANVSVKLVVLKANPAVRLYERFGFRMVDAGASTYAMRYEPPLEESKKPNAG